jgi:hypothetical protein
VEVIFEKRAMAFKTVFAGSGAPVSSVSVES